jgi:hypothetical protein
MDTLAQRNEVFRQLQEWIPTDPRRLAIFADLMVAIPLSRSLHSADLAAQIIRDVQDQSIAQMLRRFYMNPAVTWETYYLPLLRELLSHLEVPMYTVVFDTTEIGPHHRALVLSLTYHHRSLPLIWQVEPGCKGHTDGATQVALLQKLHAYLPFAKPVLFLGDSEFDDIPLLQQFQAWDWYFVCRTSPSLYIYPPDQAGFPLATAVPAPDCPPHLWPQVQFTTKHQFGPVGCYTCWESPFPAPLLLLYHLPPELPPREAYDPRFWTEPLFGDCKEAGFRLTTTHLRHAERLSRLFLVVAAAYLWMACLGATVLAAELATVVDRAQRRTLSVFKTGWRWFKRQLKFHRLVPFALKPPAHFKLPPLRYLHPQLE